MNEKNESDKPIKNNIYNYINTKNLINSHTNNQDS